MIYLVGGAPRAGKSILGQRVAAKLKVGWIATDVLRSIVNEAGAGDWDASPAAISATADWFFPYLERFIWGIHSLAADGYLIEGVHFLPRHVAVLSERFPVRSIFLGSSTFSLERFEAFPGRSRGYAALPLELRKKIVQDVPRWSEFIAREAAGSGCPYIDTASDFEARLDAAQCALTAG
jgi:2-phosphoglycerate kinase